MVHELLVGLAVAHVPVAVAVGVQARERGAEHAERDRGARRPAVVGDRVPVDRVERRGDILAHAAPVLRRSAVAHVA